MASKIDQPDRSIGFQFPTGHLGHLSAAQEEGLQKFKQLCADRGVYKPGEGGNPPSHGDQDLLRFLRARKFDLDGAYDQLVNAENWMTVNKLEDLYNSIDIQEYEETRVLYPQWTGSRDKRGMPVYLFDVGPLDTKKVLAKEKATEVKGVSMEGRKEPAKMLVVMALYENLTRFVTPWCSALQNRPHLPAPITTGCNLIDIKGTGLKQFWDLKNHLQDSSALATAYYPETLDKIFIIGAPSFFPTVWSWVKRWFDPVVVSKMFILSNSEVLKVLSEHIDPSQIPKKYGGSHEYNFGDLPNIVPDVLTGFEWSDPNGKGKLPIGPIKWEEGEDGGMVAVGVGSVNGEKRKVEVGRLNKRWRDTFFPDMKRLSGKGDQNLVGEAAGDGLTATHGGPSATSATGLVNGGVREDEGYTNRASIDSVPAAPTSAGPPKTEEDLAKGR